MLGKRLAVVTAAVAMVATVLTVTSPASAQTTPTCNGKQVTIEGTDGDDRIEGTEGNDVIWGGTGKDVIFGRGGNDTICGGPGNDVIKGGRGNDYVEGNQGNDKLVGGIGKDTMSGGSAKDKLFGGGGGDILAGNSKRDFVNGQNGTDTCDLDPQDRWQFCEAGDVIAYSGVGPATIDLDIPTSFALSNTGGGQGLQTAAVFYAVGLHVFSGSASAEIFQNGEEFSAVALNDDEDGPGDMAVSFFDMLETGEITGSADAAWTLFVPSPDAIPFVPPAFTADGPFVGQYETPIGPGQTYEWTVDATALAFSPFAGFISIVPGEFPDFNVNDLPDPGSLVTYSGDLPPGTVFVELRFDGPHGFEVL